MRKILYILFILLNFLYSSFLYAEESLTIKQQLDRIQEELSDLNRAVFNKSFEKNSLNLSDNENDVEKFTSIDIRIYDLEKDIKNLTLQFEEIIFKLDDLSDYVKKIETDMSLNFENIKNTSNTEKNVSNENKLTDSINIAEENTLGKLVLSEETSKNTNQEQKLEENETLNLTQTLDSLSPEEQLQYALDQMMKKKDYNNSKNTLELFIKKFPENQLSGSAHFWLGKIYQFESNYRKAALIFGEGVQKFPKSIKAAEMYYELSKSLIKMNKFSEACKTLSLLKLNYKDSNFNSDPEKIKNVLECNDEN